MRCQDVALRIAQDREVAHPFGIGLAADAIDFRACDKVRAVVEFATFFVSHSGTIRSECCERLPSIRPSGSTSALIHSRQMRFEESICTDAS